jgi:hypothetical protein
MPTLVWALAFIYNLCGSWLGLANISRFFPTDRLALTAIGYQAESGTPHSNNSRWLLSDHGTSIMHKFEQWHSLLPPLVMVCGCYGSAALVGLMVALERGKTHTYGPVMKTVKKSSRRYPCATAEIRILVRNLARAIWHEDCYRKFRSELQESKGSMEETAEALAFIREFFVPQHLSDAEGVPPGADVHQLSRIVQYAVAADRFSSGTHIPKGFPQGGPPWVVGLRSGVGRDLASAIVQHFGLTGRMVMRSSQKIQSTPYKFDDSATTEASTTQQPMFNLCESAIFLNGSVPSHAPLPVWSAWSGAPLTHQEFEGHWNMAHCQSADDELARLRDSTASRQDILAPCQQCWAACSHDLLAPYQQQCSPEDLFVPGHQDLAACPEDSCVSHQRYDNELAQLHYSSASLQSFSSTSPLSSFSSHHSDHDQSYHPCSAGNIYSQYAGLCDEHTPSFDTSQWEPPEYAYDCGFESCHFGNFPM